MATPDRAARNLRRLGDRIVDRADELTRRVALAVLSEVVVSTPVDTGRARGNWLVGLGGPDEPGLDEQRANADRSGQRAIRRGSERIRDRRPGQQIFVSNNVPYIGRLNDGSSAQAPAGFVPDAVAAGIEVARRATLTR